MFVAPPSFFLCGIWGEKFSHHCAFSMSAKVIHFQNFGRGGTEQNTCLSYLPETRALCNNPAPPKHQVYTSSRVYTSSKIPWLVQHPCYQFHSTGCLQSSLHPALYLMVLLFIQVCSIQHETLQCPSFCNLYWSLLSNKKSVTLLSIGLSLRLVNL